MPIKSAEYITPREHEIIKHLAEGMTVRAIAEMMGRSYKTIETHKYNMMRKLDLHNKAQIVHFAVAHGIVGNGSSSAPMTKSRYDVVLARVVELEARVKVLEERAAENLENAVAIPTA